MAPKLTSCDVFGMLLKYWLSAEGGFVGGERVNPVGVLVSGGLPSNVWCCDTTRNCDDEVVLCDVCCCDVC